MGDVVGVEACDPSCPRRVEAAVERRRQPEPLVVSHHDEALVGHRVEELAGVPSPDASSTTTSSSSVTVCAQHARDRLPESRGGIVGREDDGDERRGHGTPGSGR